MKITLAFPARRKDLADHSNSLLPLGYLTMAWQLKKRGHDVKLVHLARFRRKDAIAMIAADNPHVVGLSCFTFQRHETLEVAAQVRAALPKTFLALGGPHAGPLAEAYLQRAPYIDAVATGEAERTIVDLVETLEAKGDLADVAGLTTRAGVGRPAVWVDELDDLALPATPPFPIVGVSIPYQVRHLMASRGCGARCTFCHAPVAWGRKVRRRSVASLLRELKALRDETGLAFVSFRDDTFTSDRPWVHEVCRAMIDQRLDMQWDCQTRATALDGETLDMMRQAGCVQVQIGLETASDRLLRILRKPLTVALAQQAVDACRAAGMSTSLYLMYGIPEETDDDIAATERFVRACRPNSVSLARLSHFPGTAISAAVPPDQWFSNPDDHLYATDAKWVERHAARYRALEADLARSSPYSLQDLRQVAERLKAPSPWLSLASLLEQHGKTQDAEQCYRDVIARWPGHVWAELALGELLLATGRAPEAEAHLRKAHEAVPRWPYPLDRLGWAMRLQNRERQGDDAIARAVALDPYTPPPDPPRYVSAIRGNKPSKRKACR